MLCPILSEHTLASFANPELRRVASAHQRDGRCADMTITEYISGLAIMLGPLVAVLGIAAGVIRYRSSQTK